MIQRKNARHQPPRLKGSPSSLAPRPLSAFEMSPDWLLSTSLSSATCSTCCTSRWRWCCGKTHGRRTPGGVIAGLRSPTLSAILGRVRPWFMGLPFDLWGQPPGDSSICEIQEGIRHYFRKIHAYLMACSKINPQRGLSIYKSRPRGILWDERPRSAIPPRLDSITTLPHIPAPPTSQSVRIFVIDNAVI